VNQRDGIPGRFVVAPALHARELGAVLV
jgi:hypothetical protein